MSQIKILHVSTAKGWRGGEQQIANLLLQSRQDYPSHKMMVFCVANNPFHQFCVDNNIPVYTFQKSGGVSIAAAKQLTKICKKNAVNIVHTHDSHGHTLALLAHFLFRNAPQLIVHRRVDFPNKGVLSRLKYNAKQIAAYIPISKEIENILKETVAPKRWQDIHLIYSSVNLNKIKTTQRINGRNELNLPQNSILVGNTSALADHKDYPTFLNTAKRLVVHNSNIHFIVVGSGPLEEDIKQKTQELGLQNHVHFLGFQKSAVGYLKDFDVFLMTSKLEGLGTAVLEAFACNIPVVATSAGGIKETVLHKKTGLLAQVGDAKELAKHVKLIIQEPNVAKTLVANATQHLQQHFTLIEMTKKTNNLYQQLLKN